MVGRAFEEAPSRQAQVTQIEMARLRVERPPLSPTCSGTAFLRPALGGARVLSGLAYCRSSSWRRICAPPAVSRGKVVRGVSYGNE